MAGIVSLAAPSNGQRATAGGAERYISSQASHCRSNPARASSAWRRSAVSHWRNWSSRPFPHRMASAMLGQASRLRGAALGSGTRYLLGVLGAEVRPAIKLGRITPARGGGGLDHNRRTRPLGATLGSHHGYFLAVWTSVLTRVFSVPGLWVTGWDIGNSSWGTHPPALVVGRQLGMFPCPEIGTSTEPWQPGLNQPRQIGQSVQEVAAGRARKLAVLGAELSKHRPRTNIHHSALEVRFELQNAVVLVFSLRVQLLDSQG